MKKIILILFIIFTNSVFSQKIEKVSDSIIVNKSYYNGNKKVSLQKFYFDNRGNLLKTSIYGNHRNSSKLNKVISSSKYFYEDGKLVLSTDYLTSRLSNKSFREYYTNYKYDNENRLVNETSFVAENDSLFMAFDYTYKKNVSETHINETTYLQRKYDNQNNLIEFNQIFEDSNKIRWQHLYSYIDNCQIDDFQTYYNDDGNEMPSKSITCFDSEKRIISHESKTDSERSDFTYAENGIVLKILRTRLVDNKSEYVESVKFSTNCKINLSNDVLCLINKQLLENEY